VEDGGDVMARTLVRLREMRQSVALIGEALEALPQGDLVAPLGLWSSATPAFGIVEAWRGALTYWVRVGVDGRLERVKIVDPSFFNWRPLSYAVLDNIVPDFPLCNKSFNQSYAGNDL
jgi:Ni,Fe-hydrogenase III large subunit